MNNEHNWSYTYWRWPKIVFRVLYQIYFEKNWVQAISLFFILFRLRFIFGFAQRCGPCHSLAWQFSIVICGLKKEDEDKLRLTPDTCHAGPQARVVMSVRVTVSRVSWCPSGLIFNRFPPPVPTGVSPGPTARQSASSCCHVAKDSSRRSKL